MLPACIAPLAPHDCTGRCAAGRICPASVITYTGVPCTSLLLHCTWLAADCDGDDEEGAPAEKELSLGEAYEQLWRVVRLPSVRHFAVLLLTFRLAVLPAEAVAPLKLLEKGVSKEALAGLVRPRP